MKKITLKTSLLQKMLMKCSKCVTENKVRPISSMINIRLKGNVFSITASDDKANIITVKEDKILGEEFSLVLMFDKFYRLVQKTTAEQIILTVKDNYLEFKGNGIYKIDLPLDENNDLIDYKTFPEIINYMEFLKQPLEKEILYLSNIKGVISSNKIGLSNPVNYVQGSSTIGYYCSDNVVTSTGTTLVVNETKLFKQNFTGSKELFNLLLEIDDENINVFRFEDKILFKTTNVDIFSTELEDDRTFNYESSIVFSKSSSNNSCKVSRSDILNTLDRVGLFINKTDNGVIKLIFTDKGLLIENKEEAGSELVNYIESNNFKPFACYSILTMLKDIITPQKTDLVELFYGEESVLRSNSGNVKFIIRLFDESLINNIQIDEEDFEAIEPVNNSEQVFEDLIGEEEIPF